MQIYISVKLEGMVDYLFCIDCYAHSICAALCTYINRSSRPCVPEVPYPHMLCKSLHAKSFFWIKAENSEVLIDWHFPDCVKVIFSFPDITVFYPCVGTTSKTNQCCPSSSPFLLKLTSPCTFHFHCEINWNIFLCLEDCCLNLHRKLKKTLHFTDEISVLEGAYTKTSSHCVDTNSQSLPSIKFKLQSKNPRSHFYQGRGT